MIIPAIRGKIGNTIYYVANLKFVDVARLVNRLNSEEIYKSGSLKEALQRSLTDNVSKIRDYILNHEDRFFNAMVLAVYNGNPKWKEIRFDIEDETYYDMGLLELNGDERIFPIDGQHRLEGIKAALAREDRLQTESIPIVLIGHECTTSGIEKSRRIFSTLNRYAKPVGKGEIIALDEDDIVAITTRELLENHPLFSDNRIKNSNSKSIPTTDKTSFTTLMTLYDCIEQLYISYHYINNSENLSQDKLKDLKRTRPVDAQIEGFYSFVCGFWTAMINSFNELETFSQDVGETPASSFRPVDEGGNLFFRPVGLLPFISAVCQIMIKSGANYNDILEEYARRLERNINTDFWIGILWDPIGRKMLMRNGTITKSLLCEMYSDDILNHNEKVKMVDKYRQLFNLHNEEEAWSIVNEKYSNLLRRANAE